MGGIIVGVDGSQHAAGALSWAANQAISMGVPLTVATVFRPSHQPNPHDVAAAAGGEGGGRHQGDVAQQAQDWRDAHDRYEREQAHARIARMLADHPGPLPDKVGTAVVEARRTARALIDLAADADLLVVGSRGRGGFAELVLGSVSQQLAGHAPCPLVIVPQDS